jgi:quinol monooxygenase YgiN
MIRLLTRFVARDETTATSFARLLSRLEGIAPSEPGNLSYVGFSAAEDPLVFFSLETWASVEAIDGHLKLNAETGVDAEGAALLASPPETKTLLSLNPSA